MLGGGGAQSWQLRPRRRRRTGRVPSRGASVRALPLPRGRRRYRRPRDRPPVRRSRRERSMTAGARGTREKDEGDSAAHPGSSSAECAGGRSARPAARDRPPASRILRRSSAKTARPASGSLSSGTCPEPGTFHRASRITATAGASPGRATICVIASAVPIACSRSATSRASLSAARPASAAAASRSTRVATRSAAAGGGSDAVLLPARRRFLRSHPPIRTDSRGATPCE